MPKKPKSPIPIEQIDGMIRTIRGVPVMLDRDLAKIYGVPTKAFNQAVKRNRQRFPVDRSLVGQARAPRHTGDRLLPHEAR